MPDAWRADAQRDDPTGEHNAFVVDVERDGSEQADLWGINLYPADYGAPGWLEYDSMINLRPRLGNRTRSVEDPALRQRIATIVDELVQP